MLKRFAVESIATQTDDNHEISPLVPIKKPRIDIPCTSRDAKPVNIDESEYKMDHPSRGLAVIFHQYDYKKCISNYASCKCPSLEVKKLSDTLTNLGFDVEIHSDLSLPKIRKVLRNLTENTDHTSSDCVAIIMLAHGRNNNLLNAKKCTFPIQELWMPFCAVNCPSLAGKPKLFFIEACQAESIKGGMALRRRVRSRFPYDDNYIIPNCADFLIVYNILKGSTCTQDVRNCSWFIDALCEKLEELTPSVDVLKIMTRLTNHVALDFIFSEAYPDDIFTDNMWKTGIPHVNSTLTRDIYFHRKM